MESLAADPEIWNKKGNQFYSSRNYNQANVCFDEAIKVQSLYNPDERAFIASFEENISLKFFPQNSIENLVT